MSLKDNSYHIGFCSTWATDYKFLNSLWLCQIWLMSMYIYAPPSYRNTNKWKYISRIIHTEQKPPSIPVLVIGSISIAKAKRKLTTKQSFVVRNMKKWKQFFNFHFFLNKRRDSNTKRSLNIVDLTNFLDEEIILTHPTMF